MRVHAYKEPRGETWVDWSDFEATFNSLELVYRPHFTFSLIDSGNHFFLVVVVGGVGIAALFDQFSNSLGAVSHFFFQ